MELICKKTTELSSQDINNYCDCFSKVFLREKDPAVFQSEFVNTCLGYSFHSLLMDENGKVKGGYTSIPMLYEVNGEKMLFAFGVDLMIDKTLRGDVSNLLSIIKGNDKVLREAGVKCFYGFPNDNSYKVNLAFIRMRDICTLNTYILPWKVGLAKPSLKILNPISFLFAKSLLLLSKKGGSKNIVENLICKKRPDFDKIRYKWFIAKEYRSYQDNDMSCHWKVSNYNGTEAAFLMDVYPMSQYNFDKAVRIAYKDCSDKVGLLLYVGFLPFLPSSMVKVPLKYTPKTFHFVAKVLDNNLLSKEIIYNGHNWDVNLSSFDLL